MRTAILAVAAMLLAGPGFAAEDPLSTEALSAPQQNWSFDGPFGTFDRASAQRGYQVWQQICNNCHSLKELYYRNLGDLGFTPAEVTALAAAQTVPGDLNANGEPTERPAKPSDHFRSPYPNDIAARAANGGALPPDHSLIVKARDDGSNHAFAVLTGYRPAPPGFKVGVGLYYNPYVPGRQIAMPPPLTDGAVTYADGTPATVEQMARDVTQFLTWASYPNMEVRREMGVKVVLFLVFLTGLTVAVKRKIWKDVH